MIQING